MLKNANYSIYQYIKISDAELKISSASFILDGLKFAISAIKFFSFFFQFTAQYTTLKIHFKVLILNIKTAKHFSSTVFGADEGT